MKQDSNRVGDEKIRSAAIRKDGVVYPCWAHTYHEIKRMNLDAPDDVLKNAEQGFVTNFGRYVDRGEAFLIAQREGQIIHKHGGSEPRLYSEDTRPVPEADSGPQLNNVDSDLRLAREDHAYAVGFDAGLMLATAEEQSRVRWMSGGLHVDDYSEGYKERLAAVERQRAEALRVMRQAIVSPQLKSQE